MTSDFFILLVSRTSNPFTSILLLWVLEKEVEFRLQCDSNRYYGKETQTFWFLGTLKSAINEYLLKSTVYETNNVAHNLICFFSNWIFDRSLLCKKYQRNFVSNDSKSSHFSKFSSLSFRFYDLWCIRRTVFKFDRKIFSKNISLIFPESRQQHYGQIIETLSEIKCIWDLKSI